MCSKLLLWRVRYSGLHHCVVWGEPDVSEEHIAPIFSFPPFQPNFWFAILQLWRWRRSVSQEHRALSELHGTTIHQTIQFIITAMRTSNPYRISVHPWKTNKTGAPGPHYVGKSVSAFKLVFTVQVRVVTARKNRQFHFLWSWWIEHSMPRW
jgi:hypothetical protein